MLYFAQAQQASHPWSPCCSEQGLPEERNSSSRGFAHLLDWWRSILQMVRSTQQAAQEIVSMTLGGSVSEVDSGSHSSPSCPDLGYCSDSLVLPDLWHGLLTLGPALLSLSRTLCNLRLAIAYASLPSRFPSRRRSHRISYLRLLGVLAGFR